MKRIIVVACMAMLSGVVVAETQPLRKKDVSLTPEERAARKEQIRARMYERTGGYLIAPQKDAKIVSIVNKQDLVSLEFLKQVGDSIKSGVQLSVQIDSTNRAVNAGVVVEVVSNDYPANIMVAPENGYAMVNVRRLASDNPDGELLKKRVMKEIWRAFVYALGGGNNQQPMCLMKPVVSMADLDALQSVCPCPMAFSPVVEAAGRLGVTPVRRTSYRQAVVEGWAPQPTNDVQKVIWEEMHAKPSNPIKIKYDPAKGE